MATKYDPMQNAALLATKAVKALTAPTVAPAPTMPVTPFAGPFSGMKDGESRSWRSWDANQTGGITVIGGTTDAARQAQAEIAKTQAQATQLTADARLTGVRADLLPAESRSAIGLQGAQAGLVRAQTDALPLTTAANIAESGARVGLIGAQTRETDSRERGNNITNAIARGQNAPALTDTMAERIAAGWTRSADGTEWVPPGAAVPTLTAPRRRKYEWLGEK